MTLRGTYGGILTQSCRSSHGAWKPAPNAGFHIPTAATATVPVLAGKPTPLKSRVPSDSCTEPPFRSGGWAACSAGELVRAILDHIRCSPVAFRSSSNSLHTQTVQAPSRGASTIQVVGKPAQKDIASPTRSSLRWPIGRTRRSMRPSGYEKRAPSQPRPDRVRDDAWWRRSSPGQACGG